MTVSLLGLFDISFYDLVTYSFILIFFVSSIKGLQLLHHHDYFFFKWVLNLIEKGPQILWKVILIHITERRINSDTKKDSVSCHVTHPISLWSRLTWLPSVSLSGKRVIEVIIPLEKWQKFIFFPAIVLPCCQFLLEAHGAPEKQKQNVQP